MVMIFLQVFALNLYNTVLFVCVSNVALDWTQSLGVTVLCFTGMLEDGGEKPKSEMELLALLRDQRRRRQSYRAKNVHVTKKSYTEV
jgi:hypothetical protein